MFTLIYGILKRQLPKKQISICPRKGTSVINVKMRPQTGFAKTLIKNIISFMMGINGIWINVCVLNTK